MKPSPRSQTIGGPSIQEARPPSALTVDISTYAVLNDPQEAFVSFFEYREFSRTRVEIVSGWAR
jgi:hypothetical protein